jgi:hypothetical protein
MSSTYSTNLAIELIGAGEQAGNWGSTTNTNLGTLLEQAISGYTTYSCTGGTDTLAMTNGADATARNMFIQLNGTGGGTLVVPGTYPNANKKLYFIFNNTSLAITVKVSGQTGVSVPAAAKMLLVCTGADVVSAINYMTGATFPSPTLTGTPIAPTATLGTNTTQIATTAFVQAAAISLATIYPVGSIYTSTVSTNPNTLFGFGTWVAFGAGRVLLGDGGGYSAGATGGSADAITVSHTHTATVTDAGHSHTISTPVTGLTSGGASGWKGEPTGNSYTASASATNTATTGITVANASVGSGTSFSILNPYYALAYIMKL